jgi:hypothetical protein
MVMPPTRAASTTRPPQPPIIQTTALVFCGAAALTCGTYAGAGGGTGGGAAPPGWGPGPGWGPEPGCEVLPAAAGVPQVPQNGPWTWAPHFVQNAILTPRVGSKVRKLPALGKLSGKHPPAATAGPSKRAKEFIELRRILY